MNRLELAKSAFYGNLPELNEHVMSVNGYTMNGVWYPANSIDLSDFIATVEQMPADLLAKLCNGTGIS